MNASDWLFVLYVGVCLILFIIYVSLAGNVGDAVLLRWSRQNGFRGEFARTLNASYKLGEDLESGLKGKPVLRKVIYSIAAPGVFAVFVGFLLPIFILKFPRRFLSMRSAGCRWRNGRWQSPPGLIFWS